MELLALAFVALLFGLIIGPWLVLLNAPLFLAAGAVLFLPLLAAWRLVDFLMAQSPATDDSRVLVVEGLEPTLARALRTDLSRVLELAPDGTSPKACTCVKESREHGFVGVLRVFNSKGHYLLRTTGRTLSAVAAGFGAELAKMVDEFPARVGMKRIRCGECDAKTCPLRALAKRAQPIAAY